MKLFKNFFRRRTNSVEPTPLAIEDVAPAPMTPEPDDAELAAQALLELMAQQGRGKRSEVRGKKEEDIHSPEHFRALADKIRQAHEATRLRTLRFICFCEQQLQKPELPEVGKGSLRLLEAELYKRIEIIEREGGDMKKRWQHCLADVTVRLMRVNGSSVIE